MVYIFDNYIAQVEITMSENVRFAFREALSQVFQGLFRERLLGGSRRVRLTTSQSSGSE